MSTAATASTSRQSKLEPFGPIHAKLAKYLSCTSTCTADTVAMNTSMPAPIVDLAFRQFVVEGVCVATGKYGVQLKASSDYVRSKR